MDPTTPVALRHISKTLLEPFPRTPEMLQDEEKKLCHLAHWDLRLLQFHYIQKGLLFSSLSSAISPIVVHQLKSSLAVALRHFYPLAGRLVTGQHPSSNDGMFIAIDCNDKGVDFIHAEAKGFTVSDLLAINTDVPVYLRQFFPFDGVVNLDGESLPLVAVQVTELADGYFLGLSFNHAVGDGSSYWHFFNSWAEICRCSANSEDIASVQLSRPPVLERWFGDASPPLVLPFKAGDELIERFPLPVIRERIFFFSKHSLAKLKARANRESSSNQESGNLTRPISSLQSLSALMWRCVTRARGLPPEETTSCRMAIDNRLRLQPKLPSTYFGNSIDSIRATTTVSELMSNSLGWAADNFRRGISEHDNKKIRESAKSWIENPVINKLQNMFNWRDLSVGSSPRFEMYECEFGFGKAIAVRSGAAHKFCGRLTTYPCREAGGCMDLEVCLVPEAMEKLLKDPEFLEAISQ